MSDSYLVSLLDKQINYPIILPDSIRVVSSLLFSSCPKDCIFKLDEMARNARNTIERVLVATVEKVVILCHLVDMKEDGWFQYLEDSSFIIVEKTTTE